MKKAAFLDRDGVINKKAPGDGYITRSQDFQLLPGVAEAIALLNRAGFLNHRCYQSEGNCKRFGFPQKTSPRFTPK